MLVLREARRSSEEIHKNGLGDVVGIVSGHDMLDTQHFGTAIESLSPKDAAVRAVPLLADRLDNLVHCPSIELIISNNLEWHVVVNSIPLDGLKRIVSVAPDALVDTQENQVQAVFMSFIESLKHRSQNC